MDQLRDKRRKHDDYEDERREKKTRNDQELPSEDEEDSESEPEDTKVVPVTSFLSNDVYKPITREDLPSTGRRSKFADMFAANYTVPVVSRFSAPPPRPRKYVHLYIVSLLICWVLCLF